MDKNRISAVIPDEVLAQVKARLDEAKELLLPYSKNLTDEELRSLPKMSDKTVAFVQKVIDYATDNPKFVPGMMDLEEMKKDFTLNQQLLPILAQTEQISEIVRHTAVLAGSEAYTQGLYFHGNVKFIVKTTADPQAKVIYEDTSKRFPQSSNRKKDTLGE